MKQLTLIVCLLGLSFVRLYGQDIRAAVDKRPTVSKTVVPITPTTYKGRQIAVGSGGGITGFSTIYYLLENGKLFGRRSRDTVFTGIGQQTAINTKRVFRSVEVNAKVKTTKFDHPGNVYKFVQWRKGKEIHMVTWGAMGKTVPARYPKIYDAFMKMIPASQRLK